MGTLRRAIDDDLGRIAEIHSRSWESAYQGMLPDHFLEGVRLRHQTQWASLPPLGQVVVAEDDEEVRGFACVQPGEARHGQHLLDNLHVDPNLRSSGIGRQLLKEVLDTAAMSDPGGILYLWVFEVNVRARRFYQREGGTEGKTRVEMLSPGIEVLERRIWWHL